MRWVRKYSRSSGVRSGRSARLCPPQKCLSPAPVRIAQRMSRSSQRSTHACEIASEVGLSRMFAFAGTHPRAGITRSLIGFHKVGAMGRQIETLAAFVAQTRWEDVPAPVQRHAKLVLLDTLGVTLDGAERPEVQQLRQRLAATAG